MTSDSGRAAGCASRICDASASSKARRFSRRVSASVRASRRTSSRRALSCATSASESFRRLSSSARERSRRPAPSTSLVAPALGSLPRRSAAALIEARTRPVVSRVWAFASAVRAITCESAARYPPDRVQVCHVREQSHEGSRLLAGKPAFGRHHGVERGLQARMVGRYIGEPQCVALRPIVDGVPGHEGKGQPQVLGGHAAQLLVVHSRWLLRRWRSASRASRPRRAGAAAVRSAGSG